MIVLDEHLLSLRLDQEIASWYSGQVCYITDLRPNTVIKDEAVPIILRQVKQSTFVTGDVSGFWRKVKPHPAFCIVCVDIAVEQWHLISNLLRRLFRTEGFRTKRERMGKVVLVTEKIVRFYAVNQPSVVAVPLAD